MGEGEGVQVENWCGSCANDNKVKRAGKGGGLTLLVLRHGEWEDENSRLRKNSLAPVLSHTGTAVNGRESHCL